MNPSDAFICASVVHKMVITISNYNVIYTGSENYPNNQYRELASHTNN